MRAAILEAPHRLIVQDTPDPSPADGEIVVSVELAGVCGSDVALFEGKRPAAYPLILGHEAIGRVADGGRSPHRAGTRVVIEPNIPCGVCAVCRRGHGNVCPTKRSLGLNQPGVFAERVAVPLKFVHVVPPEIGVLDAVGLEPLAVAVHAFGVGGVRPGDAVAIIGCGSEGLLLTQVAVAMGARVLAADVRDDRLSAAERLGATCIVRISHDEPVERIAERIASSWTPVVIFESAGAATAVELALHAVALGGRVVLVGLGAQTVPMVPIRFVRRGLTLIGSLIYDHPTDFLRTIELVRDGRVHPADHVTHIASLNDGSDLLQRVASGGTGKAVLDIAGILDEAPASPGGTSTCAAR